MCSIRQRWWVITFVAASFNYWGRHVGNESGSTEAGYICALPNIHTFSQRSNSLVYPGIAGWNRRRWWVRTFLTASFNDCSRYVGNAIEFAEAGYTCALPNINSFSSWSYSLVYPDIACWNTQRRWIIILFPVSFNRCRRYVGNAMWFVETGYICALPNINTFSRGSNSLSVLSGKDRLSSVYNIGLHFRQQHVSLCIIRKRWNSNRVPLIWLLS